MIGLIVAPVAIGKMVYEKEMEARRQMELARLKIKMLTSNPIITSGKFIDFDKEVAFYFGRPTERLPEQIRYEVGIDSFTI